MSAAIGHGLILTLLLAGCGARSSLDTGSSVGDAQVGVREAAVVTRDAERDAGERGPRDAASCTTPPPLSLPRPDCPDAASQQTTLVAAWIDGGLRDYSNCSAIFSGGTSNGPSVSLAGPGVTTFLGRDPTKGPALEVAVVSVGSEDPLHVSWYCGGPGSESIPGTGVAPVVPVARLEALSSLGTCAAAPQVPGTIFVSYSQLEVEITLNGRTTSMDLGGDEGPTFFSFTIGGPPIGFIEALFDSSGGLLSGSVLFSDLGPDPGAVYCITSGTRDLQGDGTVGGLRRLGSCADAPRLPPCDEILIGANEPTGQ